MNSGRSAYCFMEALDFKRKEKKREVLKMANKLEVLITEEEIQDIVMEMATKINRDFKDGIHLIGLLKGSFVFMADLMRKLTIPVTIDFMSVTSYDGDKSSGEIKILKELNESIYFKDVLIVEDILDTGLTLTSIVDVLKLKNPKTLWVATFLDKPSRRKLPFKANYVGKEIEDKFVVGYGLDYDQFYRELPYVGVIK